MLEEFNPLAFDQLDERLQNKLRPTKPLTLAQKVLFAKMNASISPRYLRSVKAAETAALSAAGSAVRNPPLLTGGEKLENLCKINDLPSVKALEKFQVVALGKGGKYTGVVVPRPDKSAALTHSFIDWVNFTFKSHALPLELETGHPSVSDEDYLHCLSARLYDVFGYGISHKLPSGQNFYKETWNMGIQSWGSVSIGGQLDSVLVTIRGQGLMAARPGWELRLYRFLKSIPGAKLTRVDFASDNYQSAVSLDDYLNMYHAGLFALRSFPKVRQDGNWIRPDGKGRTLYIGSKESGKLLRIYEKGLQLANGFHDLYPNWIRVECEMSAKDRVIPLDSLLRPGQYLAGAYPALANLHKQQQRVETFKKTAEMTVQRSVEVTKHQFGKHIWMHSQLYGADETIRLLTEGKEALPKGINFDTWEQTEQNDFIHTESIRLTDAGNIPFIYEPK